MTLLPRSLLGRTALLIALLLVFGQVASTVLFRFYYDGVRGQQLASLAIERLTTIDTALASLPPSARGAFIADLSRLRSVHVQPLITAPTEVGARDVFTRAAYARLREEYGQAVRLGADPAGGALAWLALPRAAPAYWVGVPTSRLGRPFPWHRLTWLVVGIALGVLGAYWLVRRINRPLHELALAAQAIGRGQSPPPLPTNAPTELLPVFKAFEDMARDVQRLDHDRSLLLAGVSHDLRTPLARVRLALEMLDPADAELRASVIQDIEDMDAIITQFLAYVHDGNDEATIQGDLNALVAQVGRRIPAGDARIQLALAPLPAIAFKPLAMQRVLTNLLDNAVRYAHSDIDVRTESIDGVVRLRVLDRGPGIPAHERERLLQPFTRLAHAGSAGVGLGLAIVARIARAQGARFSLLDRDGGGLEARLELPLETSLASETRATAPATA